MWGNRIERRLTVTYSRKVGRTVLYIEDGVASTLKGGGPRAHSGMEATYRVIAAATTGRERVVLGAFSMLDQAQRYVDTYSLNFGLIGQRS